MKISIIIPVFNAAPYLDKCIKSALDQKQTAEILLIDDRSTDRSLEICRMWEISDPRVKVSLNSGVKGAGAARNIGLKMATHEFISFLDADDYFLDNRFQEDESLFQSYSNIEGVSSSVKVKYQDQPSNLIEIIGYKPSYTIINPYNCIGDKNILITGLTLKRGIISKVGLFDENFIQCEDSDFIQRLLFNCKVISSKFDYPHVIYNIHDNNTILKSDESLYYAIKFKRKAFFYSIKQKAPLSYIVYRFNTFIESEFIRIFGKKFGFKKVLKIILLPWFIFRLIFKTDPGSDKTQKIHLS